MVGERKSACVFYFSCVKRGACGVCGKDSRQARWGCYNMHFTSETNLGTSLQFQQQTARHTSHSIVPSLQKKRNKSKVS